MPDSNRRSQDFRDPGSAAELMKQFYWTAYSRATIGFVLWVLAHTFRGAAGFLVSVPTTNPFSLPRVTQSIYPG